MSHNEMNKSLIHSSKVRYTFVLNCKSLISCWMAGWSPSIPATIRKTLPPLQAIKLVAIVTAVVGLRSRNSDSAISWFIKGRARF